MGWVGGTSLHILVNLETIPDSFFFYLEIIIVLLPDVQHTKEIESTCYLLFSKDQHFHAFHLCYDTPCVSDEESINRLRKRTCKERCIVLSREAAFTN